MKRVIGLVVLVWLLASCSSGPAAPPAEPARETCTSAVCMDVPDGWGGEVGDTYLAFHHAVAPESTFLTANTVDMEAIVVAAGGSWPATTEDVMTSFWALLEEVDEGRLIRTERMVGGAIRSWGSHSTGDMWYLIVPVEGSRGIGVEIRAPNDSWEAHVDRIFPSVRPAG
ncbi:MAG: hypothetical protein ACR2N9_12790 [Acidimicrobiia bacterium]